MAAQQGTIKQQLWVLLAQGVWTPEEDAELRAMMEAGQSTKDIAESLNRLPQNCRNRWRIICTGAANKGVWCRNCSRFTGAEPVSAVPPYC